VDPPEKRTLWLPTVLYNRLRDLEVVPGDVIGVIPKGKLESQKGRYYTDFAAFKWDKDVEAAMAASARAKQTLMPERDPRFPEE
jgi:hypothetical protein